MFNSTKHQRCVYIDASSIWWLAEADGDPKKGNIKPIEHYPLELKELWSDIIRTIGENAQKIVLFYEDGEKQGYAPLGKRKLILE